MSSAPWKVVEFMHVKPGKGSAFVRSKIKNYITKSTQEMTFRAGEKLQTADVEKRKMQYTYMDGDQYVFMDMETYEETRRSTTSTTSPASPRGPDVRRPERQGHRRRGPPAHRGPGGDHDGSGDQGQHRVRRRCAQARHRGDRRRGHRALFIQIMQKIKVDTTTGKYLSRVKEEK